MLRLGDTTNATHRFKQIIQLVKESNQSTKDALQTLCKI